MSADYKRPESILVLIHSCAGEILLLKRKTPPVGIWQSVTGSLQWGETPRSAAARELYEETGIIDVPTATDMQNEFEIVAEARDLYAPGTVRNTEYVFLLELERSQKIVLNAAEHSEYCWLPAAQALETVWSWSNKAAIERFLL